MKEVISANEAAAIAAKLARVKVISAYPITPQTAIVEKLSEFVADGELDAEFIKVESEHSALSACVGAAATGVRTFTATSSQGLMLMSEILFVASGLRLPLVMANANRSLSAPLSIWCDQQDSFAVRDSGWLQIYCENSQEVLDSILQAYRVSEQVLLPVMVCFDGYILTHTAEPVDVPDQREVDEFLPPYKYPYSLDPERPVTIGAVGVPEFYEEFRYMLHEAVVASKEKLVEVEEEFGKRFGRKYGLIEKYFSNGADIVLVTAGSLSGTIKGVVDDYRAKGESVGHLRIRVFRPFPSDEIFDTLKNAKVIAVLEKDISPGCGGALFTDIAAAFVNRGRAPPLMINFICGLGGRDVSPLDIHEAIRQSASALEAGEVKPNVRWLGLREKILGLKA